MEDENFIHIKYGYCYYDLYNYKNPLIYNLFIYKKYRKMGYAEQILKYVILWIRHLGYTGDINIQVENIKYINKERLENFYKSLGLNIII